MGYILSTSADCHQACTTPPCTQMAAPYGPYQYKTPNMAWRTLEKNHGIHANWCINITAYCNIMVNQLLK